MNCLLYAVICSRISLIAAISLASVAAISIPSSAPDVELSNVAAAAGSTVRFTCKYNSATDWSTRWVYYKPRHSDPMEVSTDLHFAGRFKLKDDSSNERNELSIISVREKDAGTYSCVVESSGGQFTVFSANLTVHVIDRRPSFAKSFAIYGGTVWSIWLTAAIVVGLVRRSGRKGLMPQSGSFDDVEKNRRINAIKGEKIKDEAACQQLLKKEPPYHSPPAAATHENRSS